jgi:hypothetical protein
VDKETQEVLVPLLVALVEAVEVAKGLVVVLLILVMEGMEVLVVP